MNTILNLQQNQKLILSTEMKQSLNILKMNGLNLNEYLTELAKENPLLELESEATSPEVLKKRLKYLEQKAERSSFKNIDFNNSFIEFDTINLATDETINETLNFQLSSLSLEKTTYYITKHIINSLDDNGYLSDKTIEEYISLHFSPNLFNKALKIVQGLEPAGVGARNLQECLLIQIDRMNSPNPLLKDIVNYHLSLIERNQLIQLAKKLDTNLETVKSLKQNLLQLNPKPGNGYCSNKNNKYIYPDLYILDFGNGLEVLGNHYNMPTVTINEYYNSLKKSPDSAATTNYINQKLRQSQWIIKCVYDRERTIVKCASAILELQEKFFSHGPGHIVPMSLSDIAKKLGLHRSTISRAIANKYLQCQWGIYPLQGFLSRGISESSQDSVLTLLEEIIDKEDKQNPLSDNKIAQMLEYKDITISRRTVAKYRDILNISSSNKRKVY